MEVGRGEVIRSCNGMAAMKGCRCNVAPPYAFPSMNTTHATAPNIMAQERNKCGAII
jgi:hypothetical protein